jgi:hypothetical protein
MKLPDQERPPNRDKKEKGGGAFNTPYSGGVTWVMIANFLLSIAVS